MWQILKHELEYNKWVLACVYLVAILFFVAGLIEGDGFSGVVPNTIVPFFIGYAVLRRRTCQESRERQHCMLPQSRTHYGLTRMLFLALYQASIVLLWLITYVFYIGRSPEAIWMILSANALLLTFLAVGFIFDDTKSGMGCITSTEGWTLSAVAQRLTRFVTITGLAIVLLVAVSSAGSDTGFALLEMDVDWQPVIDLRAFLRGPMGAVTASVVFMITFYLSATFSLPRRSFAPSGGSR